MKNLQVGIFTVVTYSNEHYNNLICNQLTVANYIFVQTIKMTKLLMNWLFLKVFSIANIKNNQRNLVQHNQQDSVYEINLATIKFIGKILACFIGPMSINPQKTDLDKKQIIQMVQIFCKNEYRKNICLHSLFNLETGNRTRLQAFFCKQVLHRYIFLQPK